MEQASTSQKTSYRPVVTMDRGSTRSFIADIILPSSRDFLVHSIMKIEQLLVGLENPGPPNPPQERETLPRFKELFHGKQLLPYEVLTMALELKEAETVNGQKFPYDYEIPRLRDVMVSELKSILNTIKLRKEIHAKSLRDFCMAWFNWEARWLINRESHAVQALQPLCNAILSLEPLVMSKKKEKVLPHPHAMHQKVISYRCLEGFLHSFSELCAVLLSSLEREMDHDTKLLVLIDHLLPAQESDEGPQLGELIRGCAGTPGVRFSHSSGEKMDVKRYAMQLGKSVLASFDDKATNVLRAFDKVVQVLFSLQSTLHELSPNLDKHPVLVPVCGQFERAFKQAKRISVEPANLV